jgi:hypothetical protein
MSGAGDASRGVPVAVALVLLAGLVAAVTSPMWIFGLFSRGGDTWDVSVAREIPGYEWRDEPMSEGARKQYGESEILNGSAVAPNGSTIGAFFAKWETGKGADLSYGPHTPDVCFTASGAEPLPTDVRQQIIRVGDREIPFGRRLYRVGGSEVLVYFVHLLGGATTLEVGRGILTRLALNFKLRTDRRRQQCYILITSPAQSSIDAADAAIRSFIPLWLRLTPDQNP